jgi:hypothetical protein
MSSVGNNEPLISKDHIGHPGSSNMKCEEVALETETSLPDSEKTPEAASLLGKTTHDCNSSELSKEAGKQNSADNVVLKDAVNCETPAEEGNKCGDEQATKIETVENPPIQDGVGENQQHPVDPLSFLAHTESETCEIQVVETNPEITYQAAQSEDNEEDIDVVGDEDKNAPDIPEEAASIVKNDEPIEVDSAENSILKNSNDTDATQSYSIDIDDFHDDKLKIDKKISYQKEDFKTDSESEESDVEMGSTIGKKDKGASPISKRQKVCQGVSTV